MTKPSPDKDAVPEAHNLFDLQTASEDHILLPRPIEMDIELFGLKVLRVRFLVIQNPSDILYSKHSPKVPGIVGWNLSC